MRSYLPRVGELGVNSLSGVVFGRNLLLALPDVVPAYDIRAYEPTSLRAYE